MKNVEQFKVDELTEAESLGCNGGIFPEGSFMDSLASAISEGYRNFKSFLRGDN